MIKQKLQQSDYRIRKLIGTLGLFLPVFLPLVSLKFLASISHYYYDTLSSIIFIIILSAFGLFLLSYKGYKFDSETEMLSDDIITNIGGFAALMVVFIPTSCSGSANNVIDALCNSSCLPLFGHNNEIANTIHLICAGVFILSMGWMSSFKFTRGENDGNHRLYKWCGYLVFISVGLILIFIILEHIIESHFPLKDHYVYVFETTAVIPFGISWLVKGKAVEDVKEFGMEIFKRISKK